MESETPVWKNCSPNLWESFEQIVQQEDTVETQQLVEDSGGNISKPSTSGDTPTGSYKDAKRGGSVSTSISEMEFRKRKRTPDPDVSTASSINNAFDKLTQFMELQKKTDLEASNVNFQLGRTIAMLLEEMPKEKQKVFRKKIMTIALEDSDDE